MFSNNKKKFSKEYYNELYNIYKHTMELFETDPKIKYLLNNKNDLGFELLSIMLFYTSQKIQENISNNKLSLILTDFIHDLYYEDLKNKMKIDYDERKKASYLLNKRYTDYSNQLKNNNPILSLTRYFLNNSFNVNNEDLSMIISISQYLVECVKSIEDLTKNLTSKYNFT